MKISLHVIRLILQLDFLFFSRNGNKASNNLRYHLLNKLLQWLLLLERPIFLRAFTFWKKLIEFFVYLLGSCIIRKMLELLLTFSWWTTHKMTVGLLFVYYFFKCFENTQEIKVRQHGCAFCKESQTWWYKTWFTELIFFRNRHCGSPLLTRFVWETGKEQKRNLLCFWEEICYLFPCRASEYVMPSFAKMFLTL